MKIGLSAMKCYFGQKGTGDIGGALVSENGTVLIRQNPLCGRDYFSVFGKLKIPRTCYRFEGEVGVMPLDAQANLPERCYSYLLQEWMDFFSIRETFGEAHLSLKKLLGLNVSTSRFEVVSQDSSKDYDWGVQNTIFSFHKIWNSHQNVINGHQIKICFCHIRYA
jgi:hypothetical protein